MSKEEDIACLWDQFTTSSPSTTTTNQQFDLKNYSVTTQLSDTSMPNANTFPCFSEHVSSNEEVHDKCELMATTNTVHNPQQLQNTDMHAIQRHIQLSNTSDMGNTNTRSSTHVQQQQQAHVIQLQNSDMHTILQHAQLSSNYSDMGNNIASSSSTTHVQHQPHVMNMNNSNNMLINTCIPRQILHASVTTSEPSSSSPTNSVGSFSSVSSSSSSTNSVCKKRKTPTTSKNKKKSKKTKEDDEDDDDTSSFNGDPNVKRISSSATYLELNPNGSSKRELYISIYTSKRNRYGPKVNDKLNYYKRMKIEATVDEDKISYVNLKKCLSKQDILPPNTSSKLSAWVKFDKSDEYFFAFCQTGKGNCPPMNMLTFDSNDTLTCSKNVNLNRYSSFYVTPKCTFINTKNETHSPTEEEED